MANWKLSPRTDDFRGVAEVDWIKTPVSAEFELYNIEEDADLMI